MSISKTIIFSSIGVTLLGFSYVSAQTFTLQNNTGDEIYNASMAVMEKEICVRSNDWLKLGDIAPEHIQPLNISDKKVRFVSIKFQKQPQSKIWYSTTLKLTKNNLNNRNILLKISNSKADNGQSYYALDGANVYFYKAQDHEYMCTLDHKDITTDPDTKVMDMKFTVKNDQDKDKVQRLDYHAVLDNGDFIDKGSVCTTLLCGVPTLYFDENPSDLAQSPEKPPIMNLQAIVGHSEPIFVHRYEYQTVSKDGQKIMWYQGNSYIKPVKLPLKPPRLHGYLATVDKYKLTYNVGSLATDDLKQWSLTIHNLTDTDSTKKDIVCAGHNGKSIAGDLSPAFKQAFSIESSDENMLVTINFNHLYHDITANSGSINLNSNYEMDSFQMTVPTPTTGSPAYIALGEKGSKKPSYEFMLKHITKTSGTVPQPNWFYKDSNEKAQSMQCFFV